MRKVVLLCFALAAGLAALAAPAAAQEDGAQFTAEPAAGSSLAPTGDYFLIRAVPGRSVTQALVVRNDSKRAIELRIAAVDATTGPYGGVSYGVPSEVASRVGKWISLERRSLRLAPRAATRVSFTVSIPAGVTGGEHLGGLAIWSPASGEAQDTDRDPGQAGASINVQSRRVIAVLARLPGAAEPRLAVTGVTAIARPDGAYLELGIANRGSGLTKAKGVISLPEEGFRRRFEVDSFVPGTSIGYPIRWTTNPGDGEHRARVELQYGSAKTSWEGSFAVGEEVAEELVDRGAPGSVTAAADDGTPLATAAVAAVGAAAVAMLGGAIWLLARTRRRRRARRTAPHSPHDGAPDSRDDPPPSDDAADSTAVPPPDDVPRSAAREGRGRGPAVHRSAPEQAGAEAIEEAEREAAQVAGDSAHDTGKTAPTPVAAIPERAVVHSGAALHPGARAGGSSAALDEPGEESDRVSVIVGAAALVGGALWLLSRGRDRRG